MTKNFKSGLIVLIVLIAAIIALSVFSAFNFHGPDTGFSVKVHSNNQSDKTAPVSNNADSSLQKSYKNQYIAALYIEGTITEKSVDYDQKWLLSTIENLKNDKNNQALAVYINSPGGAVYQADEVYIALQDYKTADKKVFVYQGPMAASGGYYISCAANEIYANRNTLTGCIGVIMGTSVDMTKALDSFGIKTETIHSGKNKLMMNMNEPLTDEQRNIMQSMCDETYEQFVNIVAKSRGYSYKKAVELSDGRLYTAKQALNNGLIDCIDSWENMLTNIAEDYLEKPGIKVKTFKVEKKTTVKDFISGTAKELSSVKFGIPSSFIKNMDSNPYKIMAIVPGTEY